MGPGTTASPQTPWAPCACRPKSGIFRGARSAGCLAGATLIPATVSQLPGPWVHRMGGWGWKGRHLSPEVRHHSLLLPGHRAARAPFSSGITLGQTGGPKVLLGEQTGIFPETQALSSPSPPPRSARTSASGCMCDAYPSPPSLIDPPGQSPGLPCPGGPLSSASASPASVCDPPIYLPAARSSDVLQDSVVPLLSTQLCNSSCVYSGALTPRMLCAGYLDGRADACQVRPRAWCGAGAAGWAPG